LGLDRLKGKWKRLYEMDAYVILFLVLILSALSTYLIPAGSYKRTTTEQGISLVVPGSFHTIENHPANFLDIFVAIYRGLIDSAGMIFLVLIIGGTFAVMESTGALHTLIRKTIEKTGNREWVLLTAIMALLSLLGGLGIMSISVIALIPIGLILAKTMKLDAVVGVSIMYLGAYSGFAIGFMDPIRTGFAQQIAELPIFSGVGLRLILFVLIVAVTIIYTLRYAVRLKKNPATGILGEKPFPKAFETKEEIPSRLSRRHIGILLWLAAGVAIYVYGVFRLGWSTEEMAAIFLMIAIGTGAIARMDSKRLVGLFIEGCKKIFYGAFIIGLARSIVIVLEDSRVLDSIVQGIYLLLKPFSEVAGAIAMLFVNGLVNFIISSGTAHAAVIMPIMAPLADLMGITRQVAVTAYTLGDGFTNVMNPLSGTLMAILAMSGIPLGKWFRFVLPLVAIWFAIGIVFMAIAVLIHWGPL